MHAGTDVTTLEWNGSNYLLERDSSNLRVRSSMRRNILNLVNEILHHFEIALQSTDYWSTRNVSEETPLSLNPQRQIRIREEARTTHTRSYLDAFFFIFESETERDLGASLKRIQNDKKKWNTPSFLYYNKAKIKAIYDKIEGSLIKQQTEYRKRILLKGALFLSITFLAFSIIFKQSIRYPIAGALSAGLSTLGLLAAKGRHSYSQIFDEQLSKSIKTLQREVAQELAEYQRHQS